MKPQQSQNVASCQSDEICKKYICNISTFYRVYCTLAGLNMYTPSRFADFNLVFLREQKHNSIFLTKKIKSGQFGCGVWKHMDLQVSAGVCQSSHAASSNLHDRKLRKELISNAAFSLSPKQYLFAKSCMNTACLLRFSSLEPPFLDSIPKLL